MRVQLLGDEGGGSLTSRRHVPPRNRIYSAKWLRGIAPLDMEKGQHTRVELGSSSRHADREVSAAPARRDLRFSWLGGRPCLDYANTVAWFTPHNAGEPARLRSEYERLTRYARVVDWSREAGLLSEPEATELLQRAERDPGSAADSLQTAVCLREAIHQLFVGIAEGGAIPVESLSALNAILARGLAHRRIAASESGFGWVWEAEGQELDIPLWSVALNAAELLASDDVRRVRQCAGDDCGFLFLDKGRGPGRRWCDMAECGNRAKARRHYRRTKGSA